jgi:hypothetical protein
VIKKVAVAIISGLLIISFNKYNPLRLNNTSAKTIAMTTKSNDIEDIVYKFMPKDMELYSVIKAKKDKAIKYKDLDGDKEKEILFTFKSTKNDNAGGIIVLKKYGEEWKEILMDYGEGRLVYDIYGADINGDNKDEILIGSFIGSEEGNDLRIYKFNDDCKLQLVGEEGYHKILIRDMPNTEGRCDGRDEIALWQKANGDAYVVKVLRFNDKELVEARDVYPYYFKKVVDYYKFKLKKDYNKNNALMWYYLIDAQLKANSPKEALNSIYEVKKISPDGYGNMKKMFDKLEKQAIGSFS